MELNIITLVIHGITNMQAKYTNGCVTNILSLSAT